MRRGRGEVDGEAPLPQLFRRVLVARELHLVAEDIAVGLEISQREADGVEDCLHGLAGDVEATEVEAERPQEHQVDVIASAGNVVEAPEVVFSGIVGADIDEAAGRDCRLDAHLTPEQDAQIM